MRTSSSLLGWLSPEPGAEPSLASWRAALTAYTLRVVVIGGGLALAILLLSFVFSPPPRSVWLVVSAYPLTLLLLRFAGGSPRARAAILLSMFLVIAALQFSLFGASAAGFLCLLLSCFLAAVLIGPRAATAFLVGSLVLIALGAEMHWHGWARAHMPPAVPRARDYYHWFRLSVFWLSATGWVVFVTSWLTVRFEFAMQHKAAALASAHDESARRELSDQQRAVTETALIEAQKHEAMGRIAGGASHDFNNALFVIIGWNDLLSQGGLSEQQRKQGHAAIASAGRNASLLAKRLAAVGRESVTPPRHTRLLPLVEEGVRYLTRLLPDDIRVVSALSDVPAVSLDPTQVQQVLLNLALNARDAMPSGGRLEFALKPADSPLLPGGGESTEWIELSVRDTGIGMNEMTRARLFEPWFTTKQETGGTGLGLTTTNAIVQRARGRIEVESAPGQGSLFRVLLPASPGAPEPGIPSVPRRHSQPANVLVVEDDDSVRELIVLVLRSHGHQVRSAADGDEAVLLLASRTTQDDLLCIDGVLPGVPALAIIEHFRLTRPGCPILLCSGNLCSPELLAQVERGELPFLPKPFALEDLATRVDELLALARPVTAPV